DTRASSKTIFRSLTKGLTEAGAEACFIGIVPTPCVAFATKELNSDIGIMITASHNPPEFNGLKFMDKYGAKLFSKKELEILIRKSVLTAHNKNKHPKRGKVYSLNLDSKYINFITKNAEKIAGTKVVVDCANGSSYRIAERIFKLLGAEVIKINAKPNGLNINKNCGALFPEQVMSSVKYHNADIGFAFDGDADRVVAVTTNKIIDGDLILCLYSIFLKEEWNLDKNTGVIA
ncbi:MAG: phosphoglucosamine mutase, partial [Spirochaetes bacterium]